MLYQLTQCPEHRFPHSTATQDKRSVLLILCAGECKLQATAAMLVRWAQWVNCISPPSEVTKVTQCNTQLWADKSKTTSTLIPNFGLKLKVG